MSDLKDAVNHTVFCGQIPIGTLSMYRAAVSTNMAATVLMIEVRCDAQQLLEPSDRTLM